MTRDEWNESQSLPEMLAWLRKERRLTDRKGRLFGVACCRRLWGWMRDERSRRAVVVAEWWADGIGKNDEREWARQDALAVVRPVWSGAPLPFYTDDASEPETAAASAAIRVAGSAVSTAVQAAFDGRTAFRVAGGSAEDEGRAQVTLLRDIFNPFHCGSPRGTWRNDTGVRLAQAAYEDRVMPSGHLNPTRLALLADSLEDAGCDDAELLGHLRVPGVHVRGCWGLDAVLGKE